jgi:hypothetical protein
MWGCVSHTVPSREHRSGRFGQYAATKVEACGDRYFYEGSHMVMESSHARRTEKVRSVPPAGKNFLSTASVEPVLPAICGEILATSTGLFTATWP